MLVGLAVAGMLWQTGCGAEVSLGPVLPATLRVPSYPGAKWFPDGHLTVRRTREGWLIFWAGSSSYRSIGRTLSTPVLRPEKPVLEPETTGPDNGGAWLYAVAEDGMNGLIGFYHAEDHAWKTGRSRDGVAWKSIARCISRDGGATWKKTGRILTSARRKPDRPTWGGCGDHSVVFEPVTKRWFCFFQEHFLCAAVSDDPTGRAGTWKKWHRGGFSEPGLGGRVSPIPGLEKFPGGNPSLHFNTALRRWIMIWHSWSGHLVWSQSEDLVHWRPAAILLKASGRERYWYPTVVGESDVRAGETATLSYGYWPDYRKNERQFVQRTIRFRR